MLCCGWEVLPLGTINPVFMLWVRGLSDKPDLPREGLSVGVGMQLPWEGIKCCPPHQSSVVYAISHLKYVTVACTTTETYGDHMHSHYLMLLNNIQLALV